MIHDTQPVIDVFRRIDAAQLLGLRDGRYFVEALPGRAVRIDVDLAVIDIGVRGQQMPAPIAVHGDAAWPKV